MKLIAQLINKDCKFYTADGEPYEGFAMTVRYIDNDKECITYIIIKKDEPGAVDAQSVLEKVVNELNGFFEYIEK